MDIFLGCCILSTLLFVFIKIRFWLKVINKSKYIARVYGNADKAKLLGYELATKDMTDNFWNMILSFSFSCIIWILYLYLN